MESLHILKALREEHIDTWNLINKVNDRIKDNLLYYKELYYEEQNFDR